MHSAAALRAHSDVDFRGQDVELRGRQTQVSRDRLRLGLGQAANRSFIHIGAAGSDRFWYSEPFAGQYPCCRLLGDASADQSAANPIIAVDAG